MSDPRTTAGHRYAQHITGTGRLGSQEVSVGLDGAGGGGANYYGGAPEHLRGNDPAEDAYGGEWPSV